MGWVDTLKGKVIALDTAPLIYYTEENVIYQNVLDPFFDALERKEIVVITSIVTLLEVLVNPIKRKDKDLAQKYRSILFDTEGLNTITLTEDIAEEAARLRAVHKIRTPDSIQMATGIMRGATYFLTNDLKLPSLPELKALRLDELKTRPEFLASDDLH